LRAGHGDNTLDREASHDFFDGRFDGRHSGDIAVKYFVIQRQTIGRLQHAEHDLARDQIFLRHAKFAHAIVLLRYPFGPDRRHVIEHHGQILIDHRTQ
jgi:hypothetical protein